jgi:hypothetical protein
VLVAVRRSEFCPLGLFALKNLVRNRPGHSQSFTIEQRSDVTAILNHPIRLENEVSPQGFVSISLIVSWSAAGKYL